MTKNPYEIAHEELRQGAANFTEATQLAIGVLGLEPEGFNTATLGLKPTEGQDAFGPQNYVVISGGSLATDNGQYDYGHVLASVNAGLSSAIEVSYAPHIVEGPKLGAGLFTMDAPVSDPVPAPDHILAVHRTRSTQYRELTTFDSATGDTAIKAGQKDSFRKHRQITTYQAAELDSEIITPRLEQLSRSLRAATAILWLTAAEDTVRVSSFIRY